MRLLFLRKFPIPWYQNGTGSYSKSMYYTVSPRHIDIHHPSKVPLQNFQRYLCEPLLKQLRIPVASCCWVMMWLPPAVDVAKAKVTSIFSCSSLIFCGITSLLQCSALAVLPVSLRVRFPQANALAAFPEWKKPQQYGMPKCEFCHLSSLLCSCSLCFHPSMRLSIFRLLPTSLLSVMSLGTVDTRELVPPRKVAQTSGARVEAYGHSYISHATYWRIASTNPSTVDEAKCSFVLIHGTSASVHFPTFVMIV